MIKAYTVEQAIAELKQQPPKAIIKMYIKGKGECIPIIALHPVFSDTTEESTEFVCLWGDK